MLFVRRVRYEEGGADGVTAGRQFASACGCVVWREASNPGHLFGALCQMRQRRRQDLLVLLEDCLEEGLCWSPLFSASASPAFRICSCPFGAPFSRRAAYPRRTPTTTATPNQIARNVTATPFARDASPPPFSLAIYTMDRFAGRQCRAAA